MITAVAVFNIGAMLRNAIDKLLKSRFQRGELDLINIALMI